MTRSAVLALLASSLATQAVAAERTLSVTTFDRVRVDGPYRVKVATGVSPFAKVSGSPAAIDGVSVDQQGRTLIIRNNPSAWGANDSSHGRGPVEISVGTPDLSAAWVNGSGSLAVDKIKGLSFDLTVQGTGSAAVANAKVDQMKIAISGVGTVSIAGSAPKLTALVRGTSALDASELAVKDATIGAQGPAQVRLNASNSAKIDASGVASVQVEGGGACTVKTEGSAVVSGC
ncbi:MAG: hypothetical protein HOP96_03175 [Sphingomonas sp.]|nr:hypothetical protein [Sphingomonas sp.]